MKKFSILSGKAGQFSNPRGVTFIELVVVITVIGILATVIAFLLNPSMQLKKAKDGQRKSHLRQIQAAVEMYRADEGEYPGSLANCSGTFLGNADCSVTYLSPIPAGPSGAGDTYKYYSIGTPPLQYTLIACLENDKDSEKDTSTHTDCTSTTNVSYTVRNP